MSKFVTYPAVTVLDNDHSLLIDDPNAGTNSITAENAGNTLLSKWAGFETFEEAVQNTISNNQEFIDRDTAIREETAELKKKIVTTFPAKDASGAVATFESEFEDAPLKSCIVRVEPVQDLHGYDHPWPAGGGKNKLEVTSTSATQNGVTITVNSDGTISLSGTATDQVIFSVGSVALSGKYILSGCPSGGSYSTYFLFCVSYDYGSGETVTFDGTSKSVQIYVRSGVNTNGLVFKPMIRPSSISDNTWQPYSNICPITGWTGCEVQRTGKNFFNPAKYESQTRTFNGITYTVLSDGSVRAVGTSTAAGGPGLTSRFQLPAGTYYGNSSTGSDLTVLYRYAMQETGGKTYPMSNPFVSDGTQWFYINLYCDAANLTVDTILCPQIELGTSFTGFEPYTGRTYPITFPTEAGTVYGGYVDVINGELVVDMAIADLGTLSWTRIDTSSPHWRFWAFVTGMLEDSTMISNQYAQITPSAQWTGVSGIATQLVSGMPAAMVSDERYETVEDFKAAMSGVQLVYELETPIHYPLTPTEIKTLLGTNNVWANCGDTAVEYLMSDVSWYVEKKLRAFQSILTGVEDSAVASKNYSTDSYLIFNNDIYRVTKTITAGETIEDGVNVTKTTVAEQLLALAQA